MILYLDVPSVIECMKTSAEKVDTYVFLPFAWPRFHMTNFEGFHSGSIDY